MECKFTLLTILVASVGIATAQNYCSKSLCGNLQHIACNNNGNFAARCTNPTLLQLTEAQKNIILQVHNNRRNQVAGGQTKLQPACRMTTMQYVIGHFTVMVADRNIRVGCAAETYKATAANISSFLMACNYATTNIVNRPIYKTCATAASGCTTGKNTNYPNLCSTSESCSV